MIFFQLAFVVHVIMQLNAEVQQCYYCVPVNDTQDCNGMDHLNVMQCPQGYTFACVVLNDEFVIGLRGCASKMVCANNPTRMDNKKKCCDADLCNNMTTWMNVAATPHPHPANIEHIVIIATYLFLFFAMLLLTLIYCCSSKKYSAVAV